MLHPFRICTKFENGVALEVIGSKVKVMMEEVVVSSKRKQGEGEPNRCVDASCHHRFHACMYCM